MRRYTFYLSVALLAFGIGLFVVFKFYFNPNEEFLTVENSEAVENISEIEPESEKIKYDCNEKEFIALWENLDKKAFLKFKESELKELNKNYPEDFEEEWRELNESFGCSHLGKFVGKEIDLNSDGENEIYVLGKTVSNRGDGTTYIFQKISGKYRVILFHGRSIENEIKKTKTKNYSDIVFSSNWSGGSRTTSYYKYNGTTYKAVSCFEEAEEIIKNGKWIQFEKIKTFKIKCGPYH